MQVRFGLMLLVLASCVLAQYCVRHTSTFGLHRTWLLARQPVSFTAHEALTVMSGLRIDVGTTPLTGITNYFGRDDNTIKTNFRSMGCPCRFIIVRYL